MYGVAVAILVRSRCRSASSSAPLVVTAAGAPASIIADTSAASPARPPTKLPDVHAYAVTNGETARTSVTPRATSAGSEMCTAISMVAGNGA